MEQHQLVLPGITLDAMLGDLTLAQRIRPLADAVQKLARRLDDTAISANSDCWSAATSFYTALARSAANSPALEAALRPVVSFFATGARKKMSAGGTPHHAAGVGGGVGA